MNGTDLALVFIVAFLGGMVGVGTVFFLVSKKVVAALERIATAAEQATGGVTQQAIDDLAREINAIADQIGGTKKAPPAG